MRKHIAGPAELVGKLVFAHELSEHEGWGEVEHAGQKVVAPAVRHAHHHLLQNSIPFQFRFTIGPFINHSVHLSDEQLAASRVQQRYDH